MTPEQLAAQLPQGYKVHQNLNDHGVEVVQVHHAFLDAHSQSYPLAEAHLALGWALDHASRYDADKELSPVQTLVSQLPTGYGWVHITASDHHGIRYPDGEVSKVVWKDPAEALEHAKAHAKVHASRYDADKAAKDQEILGPKLAGAFAKAEANLERTRLTLNIPEMTFTVDARHRKLADGRTVPEGWGILQSKRAMEAGTMDGWNITTPNHIGDLIEAVDRDVLREWPTPEAALNYIEELIESAERMNERNQPSNELCAVTIPTDEDRAAAGAIALPEGYSIRIRGALGNTPQQYRAIYPDKDGRTLHPTAELAAQECIRHYIEQHTRRMATMPPGYQLSDVADWGDSALMHVIYPDGGTSDLMDYTYEKLKAHAWDHFEAQPDRKDCPPGYRVVNVDGDGEYWEVIHPTGPDGNHFERREWAVAAARDYHHLLVAREGFRRLGMVKGEPGTAQGSIEERLAAARAQLPEKYQIDPVGSRFRVSFYGAITGRDRKTPEAALSWAQRHEALSRIRLEEGVEHSHRDKIAALIQPHPNMTAEGRLSGNGSGTNTYSMWRLYYCNAVSPWFSIIVLDNLKLNIADLLNVQPQEVTAMTHPAHEGRTLNEIKKMIQLLENGEWADTHPTTAEGQRLEQLLNNMIALQRKSDAAGHLMADQLQELRAKPESSRLAYEEMEALRQVFETNDVEGLKAFEPKYAITSVWQTALYDRMQEHAKREAELRRLVAETDLKAISASEPAPAAQPYYTLEDKIVDLAIDVIAGTAHPERAKVLLREIIKEAKA